FGLRPRVVRLGRDFLPPHADLWRRRNSEADLTLIDGQDGHDNLVSTLTDDDPLPRVTAEYKHERLLEKSALARCREHPGRCVNPQLRCFTYRIFGRRDHPSLSVCQRNTLGKKIRARAEGWGTDSHRMIGLA